MIKILSRKESSESAYLDRFPFYDEPYLRADFRIQMNK